MARLVHNGGFCAVNVDPRYVERAEHQLVSQHGFELVDLDTVLIQAMQGLARESGADWPVVMDADADAKAPTWRLLQNLVRRALATVREKLIMEHSNLLLTCVGLLARYRQVELLGDLRDVCTGTQAVDGASLHSMVVVVASQLPEQLPMLGDVPVPVIGANQWTSMPRRWLDSDRPVAEGGQS